MSLIKKIMFLGLFSSFAFAGMQQPYKFSNNSSKANYLSCQGNLPGAFYFNSNRNGSGSIINQQTGISTIKKEVAIFQILSEGQMAVTFSGQIPSIHKYIIAKDIFHSNLDIQARRVEFTPKLGSLYNCEYVEYIR